jgi:FkbM family methyltransferase
MSLRSTLEPFYASLLGVLTAGRGVAWRVDGTTTLRIDPRCRWIRNPSYEAAVVEYLRSRIRPGDCCVDVGAHVGYYALQMALWTAPSGRVIAFEPNPSARTVLETNVALNAFTDRVVVEPTAVSDAPGTAPLFHGGETTGLSRIGTPNPGTRAGKGIDVPVVTLDDYCASHRTSPHWVLIDAEGLELQVLEGSRRLLAESAATFVVEMHPDLWSDRAATASRFEALLLATGRTALPLTGQRSAFEDYGSIALCGGAVSGGGER